MCGVQQLQLVSRLRSLRLRWFEKQDEQQLVTSSSSRYGGSKTNTSRQDQKIVEGHRQRPNCNGNLRQKV